MVQVVLQILIEGGAEKQDAQGQDKKDIAGTASGMQPGITFGILDRQFVSRFIGKDRFVFGAMILKHPPDILQAADRIDIYHKHGHHDQSFDQR